ncbi:MAG TPA: Ppx/GppA phosphatase family protein [Acidimicrobiales bacterium]|nr:Ppx/GppA phosphatase family protein [Acidimicrobiales bacterium]
MTRPWSHPPHPALGGQADAPRAVTDRVHAAIDIGTNSVHLLVARSTVRRRFEVLAQEKEVVRLGSGATDMKLLTDDAMDRGIAALHRFRQVADIWEAEISAVATSAVREAENHQVFLDRARRDAGIEVEVISGVEEARLIHLGILQALPVFEQRLVLVDIGGGSTELLVGHRGHVVEARSLKLGAVRLTERFFADEPLREHAVEECRAFTRSFLQPAARDLRLAGFDVAAGSSGTIEAIARMVDARRGGDPARSLNGFELTAAELADAVATVVATDTAKARERIPGLDPRRADIIVAGAIILEQVVAALGIETIHISEYALREGVILDLLQRSRGDSLDHLSDLRRESVVHLSRQLDPDREHSEHTTQLALRLFDATRELHQLGDHHRELLEAAALLHNVGLFISHSAHHKHSYYVIRNSEHLLGFTDHEIELIAQVARYHRKSAPKDKHPEFAALRADDRTVVRVLAGLLRVAIGLDRAHALAVADVVVETDPDSGAVVVGAVPAPDSDPTLEVYTAAQRADLLADALGVVVRVEARGPDPAAAGPTPR